MTTTSDRNDPRLTRGADDEPVEMAEVYLVLSDAERAKGFVRPVRTSYRHETCGAVTTMGAAIAETYRPAADVLRRDVLCQLLDAPAGRARR